MNRSSNLRTVWAFTALALVALSGCAETVLKPHCYVVPQEEAPLDSGKMRTQATGVKHIVVCLKPQMMPAGYTHTAHSHGPHTGPGPGPGPGPAAVPLEGSASLPREGALAIYGNEHSDTTNGAQAYDPDTGTLSVNARDLRARLDAVRNGDSE